MGQFHDRGVSARVEYDEESENGFIFGGMYLPEELLAEIFGYVNYETLLNCQLVCKRWNTLICDYVWRKKAETIFGKSLPPDKDMPWCVYYLMCKKKPFERNLVKNHSGELGVSKHWSILREGGDQWTVENPPLGVPPLPATEPVFEGKQFCFVTSFHYCCKKQTIDLEAEGFIPYVLDVLQPPIVVGEWYSCRWDCPAMYDCTIQLIADSGRMLDSIEFKKTIAGEEQNQWHHVSHEFKNYGSGLRKITFCHGGIDKSFWAGHYGSKMAGASVVIKIPVAPHSEEEEQEAEAADKNLQALL